MRGLLDVLYPPRCAACRELLEGGARPLCRRCRESLAEVPERHCRVCCEPDVVGLCGPCAAARTTFEKAEIALLHGGAVAEIIHRFKYEACPHLARTLVELAWPRPPDSLAWCDLIAPVSLHVSRLRTRGYDQALLLAREFAARGGRPVVARAVRRLRATAPQVGRDRQARERNVAGAFCAERAAVEGRRVLLVDDVLTTGATANAAAQALLDAGASAVRLVAIARAE